MKTHSSPAAGLMPHFGGILSDAIAYWERRRIAYNIALAVVALGWTVSAWARLRDQLDVQHLLALFVLAVLANVCYCAAYLVDVPMQLSTFRYGWRRRRWLLWLVGTLFGMALAWFWIADEILPAVGRP
ncbi:hypothetical protein [Rhodanobacter geophilus]|uniref:Uncharacterized protein n=1 Tax=Rhodanobacter geophilus TaxID=3162488 RepID=A0ABV3QM45_9GAMM